MQVSGKQIVGKFLVLLIIRSCEVKRMHPLFPQWTFQKNLKHNGYWYECSETGTLT